MGKYILTAYVDGSDLEDIASNVLDSLATFIDTRTWICPSPWLVDHRQVDDEGSVLEILPDWDLGLNLSLPDTGSEAPRWSSDIEALVRHLGKLHELTGRDFVIGLTNIETGISERLFVVRSPTPDLDFLRKFFNFDDPEVG